MQLSLLFGGGIRELLLPKALIDTPNVEVVSHGADVNSSARWPTITPRKPPSRKYILRRRPGLNVKVNWKEVISNFFEQLCGKKWWQVKLLCYVLQKSKTHHISQLMKTQKVQNHILFWEILVIWWQIVLKILNSIQSSALCIWCFMDSQPMWFLFLLTRFSA